MPQDRQPWRAQLDQTALRQLLGHGMQAEERDPQTRHNGLLDRLVALHLERLVDPPLADPIEPAAHKDARARAFLARQEHLIEQRVDIRNAPGQRMIGRCQKPVRMRAERLGQNRGLARRTAHDRQIIGPAVEPLDHRLAVADSQRYLDLGMRLLQHLHEPRREIFRGRDDAQRHTPRQAAPQSCDRGARL